MSGAKHTPGPWEIEESRHGDEVDVYPLRDGPPPVGRWAEVCTVKDCESQEEMRANARLIAAAPELLEGAKSVIKLFRYHTEDAADAADFAAAVEIQIEAAIAKAEGRTNA